jgi:hypothetical protein
MMLASGSKSARRGPINTPVRTAGCPDSPHGPPTVKNTTEVQVEAAKGWNRDAVFHLTVRRGISGKRNK